MIIKMYQEGKNHMEIRDITGLDHKTIKYRIKKFVLEGETFAPKYEKTSKFDQKHKDFIKNLFT